MTPGVARRGRGATMVAALVAVLPACASQSTSVPGPEGLSAPSVASWPAAEPATWVAALPRVGAGDAVGASDEAYDRAAEAMGAVRSEFGADAEVAAGSVSFTAVSVSARVRVGADEALWVDYRVDEGTLTGVGRPGPSWGPYVRVDSVDWTVPDALARAIEAAAPGLSVFDAGLDDDAELGLVWSVRAMHRGGSVEVLATLDGDVLRVDP